MNLMLSMSKNYFYSNYFKNNIYFNVILNFRVALNMKLTAEYIKNARSIVISKEKPLNQLFESLKAGCDEEICGNYTLIPPAMKEVNIF